MICIPITANNLDDALRDMAEASKFADIIEVRLDYIKKSRPEIHSGKTNKNPSLSQTALIVKAASLMEVKKRGSLS